MKRRNGNKDFLLIAFIVPGKIARPTGGSIYDKRLADHLRERGARVEVVSVPDLSYFTGALVSPLLALWLALRIAGRGYDLIIEDGWGHPSFFLFNIAFRFASKSRFVIIVHQLRWVERKRGIRIAAIIERCALRSGHLIVTVSRFMCGEIASLIGANPRILVVSPGSDLCLEHRREADTPAASPDVRLLFVGNCARRKGLHLLIRALSQADCHGLTLDVVGDYDFEPRYYEELRREVALLGSAQTVKFHGRVSNETLRSFYARADIFVMPSLYEGFGMVYAEAMRAGLPIIALDTGPVPEIVQAGENGLLVPLAPEESLPFTLARAICKLATDVDMRARFSRRSIEIAKQLPSWKEACEIIYRNLLSLIESESDFTGRLPEGSR